MATYAARKDSAVAGVASCRSFCYCCHSLCEPSHLTVLGLLEDCFAHWKPLLTHLDIPFHCWLMSLGRWAGGSGRRCASDCSSLTGFLWFSSFFCLARRCQQRSPRWALLLKPASWPRCNSTRRGRGCWMEKGCEVGAIARAELMLAVLSSYSRASS